MFCNGHCQCVMDGWLVGCENFTFIFTIKKISATNVRHCCHRAKFGGFRGRRNPLPSLSFIILHFYFDWMVTVVAAHRIRNPRLRNSFWGKVTGLWPAWCDVWAECDVKHDKRQKLNWNSFWCSLSFSFHVFSSSSAGWLLFEVVVIFSNCLYVILAMDVHIIITTVYLYNYE